MRAAEREQIREGAIRSFVVPLDSELAQIRNEGVGLRRRDTPFAFGQRKDVRNFDEPPSRHERRLDPQPPEQSRRFVVASSPNSHAIAIEQSSTNAALIAALRRSDPSPSIRRGTSRRSASEFARWLPRALPRLFPSLRARAWRRPPVPGDDDLLARLDLFQQFQTNAFSPGRRRPCSCFAPCPLSVMN